MITLFHKEPKIQMHRSITQLHAQLTYFLRYLQSLYHLITTGRTIVFLWFCLTIWIGPRPHKFLGQSDGFSHVFLISSPTCQVTQFLMQIRHIITRSTKWVIHIIARVVENKVCITIMRLEKIISFSDNFSSSYNFVANHSVIRSLSRLTLRPTN